MIKYQSIDEYHFEPIVIELHGIDGSPGMLIARARHFAQQLGFDKKQISEEMIAGDYENLLHVFEGYFGHFVILKRLLKDDYDEDED